MAESTLRFAVRTDAPIPDWQARCIDLLAAVCGVVLDEWIRQPSGGGPGEASRDEGADAGSEPGVDVMLDLSAGTSPLAAPPSEELWRFGFGAGLSRDFARVALADYARGPGMTRTALISEPTGTVVREGWPRSVGWPRQSTLDARLLELAEWPAAAARDRLAGSGSSAAANAAGVDASPANLEASPDDAGVSRPRRLDTLPRPLLSLGAWARRAQEIGVSLTRHPEWNVGVLPAPIAAMVGAGDKGVVQWLPSRGHAWAADPFGIERDGVLHVFFEDFVRRVNRGVISHIAVSPDGTVSDPEVVLDVGVHASYPFLVERAGSLYMLPETSAAGELVLYEAVDIPHRWQRAATLLPDVPAVDASVVEFEGRWWLFAGILGRGQNHTLFVWHAPDLTGPWTAHAANPVKTDARSTRGGGTPFVVDGRLYRPSQDCSRTYGGRVVLNHVEVLTPTAFRERPVKAFVPREGSPYPNGLHTLSAAGTRTLIDGYGRRFVREDMQRQVRAKLGR